MQPTTTALEQAARHVQSYDDAHPEELAVFDVALMDGLDPDEAFDAAKLEALVETKNLSEDEIERNFTRAAEESLAHYKTTGLHITHKEFNAWLDTWGTPNPAPMPECHT